MHQHLEGVTTCTRCHESDKEISGARCLACHMEISTRIDAGRGYHATVASQSCIDCHKEHIGRDARITQFDEKTFDHTLTGFTLTGKHASIACEQCHSWTHITAPDIRKILADTPHKTFLGLESTCAACHADRHQGTLGKQCQTCHGTLLWLPVISFDHGTTQFPLTDRHATVACARCHTSLDTKETEGTSEAVVFHTQPFEDCTPCHASPHRERLTGIGCAPCHAATGWGDISSQDVEDFDHATTRFPLTGRHQQTPCTQCHTEQEVDGVKVVQYQNTPATCGACHTDTHVGQFAGADDTQCAACHTSETWQRLLFNHETQSEFPLTDTHRDVACDGCHYEERDTDTAFIRYKPLKKQCESCHPEGR